MEPIYYVRIVRRRLRLVVACTLIGALLGLASTVWADSSSSPNERYLASHILWDNGPSPGGDEGGAVDLANARLLMTRGEVPRRVAEELGGSPLELLSQIHVVVNGPERTITVHAVTSSPERSEELADAFALEGLAALVERDREFADNELAVLDGQIADQTAELDELRAQRASVPPEELAAHDGRIDEAAEALAALEDQRDQVASRPLPSERLGTLEQAQAIPVTQAELDALVASSQPQSGNTAPVFGSAAATPSGTPITDNAAVRTAIGGIFGLLLGVGLAVTIQRFDRRIRNKEEAEEAFGLPVIGEIPDLPKSARDKTAVVSFEAPRSPTAEAYRALRSSLVFVGHTAPPTDERLPSEYADERPDGPAGDGARRAQVILVTSPGPGEGKTTSAANLAAVLAETGYSVLAINCDFRKPRLHKYLGADPTPRKVVETTIPGVRTITDVVSDSSRLNPAEVVAAQRKVIESARELFDIIVLDTAPLLATNDAVDLLAEADLVVVCCRAGQTTREGAERTVESLKRHEAPVAGCVIVGADEGPAASYYYYYGDHDGRPASANGNGRSGSDAGTSTHAASAVGAVVDARQPG